MPLNAANMVWNGHLLSADIRGFYDLLVGNMYDQPVTLRNTLTVGMTVLCQSRLATNNYNDVNWPNSLGGNCLVNGVLWSASRLVTNGWDAGGAYSNSLGGNLIVQNEIRTAGNRVFWGYTPVYLSREDWGNGEILECNRAIAGLGWQVYNGSQQRTAYCDENGNINAHDVQWSTLQAKSGLQIVTDEWALEKVLDTRVLPSRFEWRHNPGQRHVGLIAEDVAAVVPELGYTDDHGELSGYYTAGVLAILWGAVRALEARVAYLEGEGR